MTKKLLVLLFFVTAGYIVNAGGVKNVPFTWFSNSSGDAIRTSGNVGIGTSSPGSALHVIGSASGGIGGAVSSIVQSAGSGTSDFQPILRLKRTSAGTTAAGFGTGIEFYMEDFGGSEDRVAAAIGAAYESGDGNYEGALVFYNRDATASIAEAMRLTHKNYLALKSVSAKPPTLASYSGIFSSNTATSELYSMDGSGNATLISPHLPGTDRWVFKSCNEITKRCVDVDMEKLVKTVEALSGEKLFKETYQK